MTTNESSIKISRMHLAGVVAAAILMCGVAIPVASAQANRSTRERVIKAEPRPEQVNLARMTRRVTIELEDARLEDVLNFLQEFTQADIEVLWTTDRVEGLDKDQIVSITAKNMPALTFLEQILDKAQTDFAENGWQITKWGSIEIGPKDRLNRRRRVEIYDINDLLMDIPAYTDVPEIDLQSVLQQGEGGGGQSPFNQGNQGNQQQDEPRTRQEKAEELMDIITTIVEPDQWVDNGGEAASIRFFQGHLIVNAPDYVHRQISGYNYWPSAGAKVQKGRRYVSLNLDTGFARTIDFASQPVTGVVGGGGGTGTNRSGSGAGGQQQPAPSKPAPSPKP